MAIIQIKRGNRSNIPSLNDGEFYLAKDENRLIISNNSINLEIANYKELASLSEQLTSLSQTVNLISENVSTLNQEVDKKITKPIGEQGQILGYDENLDIVALNYPNAGNSIIISTTQPENQNTGDLWLKEI